MVSLYYNIGGIFRIACMRECVCVTVIGMGRREDMGGVVACLQSTKVHFVHL